MMPNEADYVTIDKNIRGGEACILNTRVPVSQMLSTLTEEDSVKEFAEDMDLNYSNCLKALQWASHKLMGSQLKEEDMGSKLYLEITADTNDGDYIKERTRVSAKDLESFKPLIAAIKTKGRTHNWITSDYIGNGELPPKEMYASFGEELIEQFDEYVPRGEYGVHTIKHITLLKATEEELL